ncbi:putative protein phosphatase [Trypanosoma cruzi]|uniref:Serine/threonine-protein phosphatase n=2 Tax=Trypanosoma cruzi TaxID=5693 RepID=Q4DRW5_TRYCC|nr:protein phosphotase, putative [Trypanosoma cruzi]EAN95254.1 protein phosphotase, putative [Trypanosoma cruzi]PWV10453.1 putative protein phosphatase [Trypanosoma cruzi]|eukprot:XP_817105.1 protein phosphotase [Trypanosoma cruzi strain CL Brener]
MWDNRCVVVESGRELRIGLDVSCDIVVQPPQSRAAGAHIVASRHPILARISCTAEEELLLSIPAASIAVYVNNIKVGMHSRPLRLPPGSFVSFIKCCKQTTFRFFTISTYSVAVPTPESTSNVSTPEALEKSLRNKPLLLLPLAPTGGEVEEINSPRSPRVVQIVGSAKENKAELLMASYESQPLEETEKSSCQGLTDPGSSGFTHNMPPYMGKADTYLPPSPHAIVPYVVELLGERAALHTIMDQSSLSASEIGQSSDPKSTKTKLSHHVLDDPYMTCHGYEVLKGVRYMRFETPVRSAAANVLECIEDAYEPEEGIFLKFTESSRKMLLEQFFLLAEHAIMTMSFSPLTIRRRSPIFCCGDIHGSFADLKFIADSVVPFRHWSLMTTPVLFLGDYVDRGLHDVEVVLYLLSWQTLCPENVIILRGNHEDEEINGDVETYGDLSFRKKCWDFFGNKDGEMFWRRVNDVFATLPLMAIVDDTIFACHGGIPLLRFNLDEPAPRGREEQPPQEGQQRREKEGEERDKCPSSPREFTAGNDGVPHEDLLKLLMDGTPSELSELRFRCLMPVDNEEGRTAQFRRLVRELLWNDPVSSSVTCDTPLLRSGEGIFGQASDEHAFRHETFDAHGFRSNMGRGDDRNIIREFTAFALESFMQRWGFTLLIRAHQQKMSGLEMGFSGRILTLFSCCNYLEDMNRAGACIILNQEVRPISWRRSAGRRVAEEKFEPLQRRAGPALWSSGSLPESFCSIKERPMKKPVVPSYVGSSVVSFG